MRTAGTVAIVAALIAITAFSTPVSAQQVFATVHGMDLEQGEGGGGPLYEDGTANGNFAISVANGALIFTVKLERWFFADADHIVICGAVSVQRNDFGIPLPPNACSTPIPISGFPVESDLSGDGRVDHKEWVRLVNP